MLAGSRKLCDQIVTGSCGLILLRQGRPAAIFGLPQAGVPRTGGSMLAPEPAMRQAAALTVHMERKDIEAVVLMLTDLASQEEAEDVIVALLLLRGRSDEDVRGLIQ
jgi:hypothetical protein